MNINSYLTLKKYLVAQYQYTSAALSRWFISHNPDKEGLRGTLAFILRYATMKKLVSYAVLEHENHIYKGRGGVSQENRSRGFLPAFYDAETQTVDISRFANGFPAPIHLFDGVPEEWVVRRDQSGRVTAIKSSVIAGFVREGRFYTREEVVRICTH
jgi:hypothetical protein